MREIQLVIADDLPSVLDRLYRQFGVWKMARAIAAASWRHWRSPLAESSFAANHVGDLSERMLSDIGYHPQRFVRPAARRWEHRL